MEMTKPAPRYVERGNGNGCVRMCFFFSTTAHGHFSPWISQRKRLQRTENKFPGSPYLTVAKGADTDDKSNLQAVDKAEEGEIS